MFNSIFGWQNSATYGSVISYNLYWLVVIIGFLTLRYKETKGRWPLMKAKARTSAENDSEESSKGVMSDLADMDKNQVTAVTTERTPSN